MGMCVPVSNSYTPPEKFLILAPSACTPSPSGLTMFAFREYELNPVGEFTAVV